MSSIKSDAANKHRVQIKYDFSIKNLIQNKSKSTGRNCKNIYLDVGMELCRLDPLWVIIWQLSKAPTISRY